MSKSRHIQNKAHTTKSKTLNSGLRTPNIQVLREKAEQQLAKQADRIDDLSKKDIKKLVHELGTYQIELEMQNEELRRAQGELEKSRGQYVNLYDFAPVGYYTFDKNGIILDVNLAGASLLWKEKGFLINKPFSVFIRKDDQDIFYHHRREVFDTHLRRTCEIRLKSESSAEIHTRLESIPDRDEQGNFTRMRTAMSNITEIKMAEKALAEKEARYRTIFEGANDGILAYDIGSDDFLFANKRMSELTGYPEEELLRLHVKDMHPPKDLPYVLDQFRKAAAGKIKGGKTIPLLRKDKSVIYCDISSSFAQEDEKSILIGFFRDVTKQVIAEEHIKHLASFPDLNPNPVMETDSSGNIIYFNHAIQKILEDLGPDNNATIFLPDDFEEILRKLEKKPETFYREIVIRDKIYSSTIHLTPQFNVVRMYANDITERKKVENAVIKAKEEWERTFDSVPDLIAILDREHRIARANRAMAERLGTSPDKCVGLKCFSCVHGTSIPPAACPHTLTMEDGREHTAELREDRLGGDFLVTTTPLFDKTGRMYGSVHVARDITERKKHEEATRSAYARYYSFIAVTGQIGWTTNPAGEVVEDLPEWRNYTGQSFDDIKGWGWSKAIHPDDLAHTAAAWKKSVREKIKYEVEYRIRRHDGNYRLFMARGTPVFKKDGTISEWVGTCIDITERKLSEDKLHLTLAELQQRQLEVSALLDASRTVIEQHDFRETAKSIFNSCKLIIGATAGYIALLSKNEMENDVIFLDSGGLPCTVDPSLPMPVRGLRGVAYRTGSVVYENDFSGSEWEEYMPDGHAKLDNVLFAPMTVSGKVIGLLGLANKTGGFTDNDTRMAAAFGEFAAIALHNSRLYESLKDNEEKFRSVVQTANDAIITFNGQGNILFWNRGVEDIFGYGHDEVKDIQLGSLMPERFGNDHRGGAAGESPAGIIGKRTETTGRRKDGVEFPIELSLAKWKSGEQVFFTGILRDITDSKEAEKQIRTALEEKELLLREIHHRVKNNMTVIFSLLKLQSRHVRDDRDRDLFDDSMARIKSMALIHEKLYRSKNMAEVNFSDYIKDLTGSIFMSYKVASGRIALKTEVDNVFLGIDTAIPCGLIVNELVSNAMKHAFPNDRVGEIMVSLTEIDNVKITNDVSQVEDKTRQSFIELTVGDNGAGLPDGIDIQKSDTLGMNLINALVRQIHGQIEIVRGDGTEFRIRFKN